MRRARKIYFIIATITTQLPLIPLRTLPTVRYDKTMQTRSGRTIYNTLNTSTAATGDHASIKNDLQKHPERKTNKYKMFFIIVHLLGLLAHSVGVFLSVTDADLDVSMPLWRINPKYSCSFMGSQQCAVRMKTEKDVTINPASIVVAWFSLSAAFHCIVLLSIALGYSSWYFRGMDYNLGFWRWIEYTGSASIMLLGATSLIGTRETRVVISSTISIGVTMFFGWLTELNAHKYITPVDGDIKVFGHKLYYVWDNSSVLAIVDRFHVHVLGYVPFALAWWLALDSFWTAEDAWVTSGAIVHNAGESLIAGFALFTLFGFVQLILLILPYGPSVYWIGEICYCVLSVAAKWTMGMLLLYRGLTFDRIAQASSVPVLPT